MSYYNTKQIKQEGKVSVFTYFDIKKQNLMKTKQIYLFLYIKNKDWKKSVFIFLHKTENE